MLGQDHAQHNLCEFGVYVIVIKTVDLTVKKSLTFSFPFSQRLYQKDFILCTVTTIELMLSS